MVHLVYQDASATFCQKQAAATARQLRRRAHAEGLTDIEVIGPAPGIPARLRGRYRWHLVLRGRNLQRFLEGSGFPKGCTVDVDPAHLL
jgi:primosomal protein N' (replication factor Y)